MVTQPEPQTPQERLAALRRQAAQIGYQVQNAEAEVAELQAKRQWDLWESRNVLAAPLRADAEKASALYAETLDDLAVLLTRKSEIAARLSAAKRSLEEAEAMLLLNGGAEGKNAEERKARLLLAVRDDPGCQQARADLAEAEREQDENNAAIVIAERRLDGAKLQLRVAAATLEMLSS